MRGYERREQTVVGNIIWKNHMEEHSMMVVSLSRRRTSGKMMGKMMYEEYITWFDSV